MTDAFGNVLVEGDGITEAATAWVRGRRQETVICRVATVDIWVRDAAEDGKVLAMLLQEIEVRRGLVIGASALREKVIWHEAKVITDTQHAARLTARSGRGWRRRREGRRHRVEQR